MMIKAQFTQLAEQWEKETGIQSNLDEHHPLYQAVIALGEPAIPLLLERIQSNPHWCLALARITKVWPALPEHAGQMANIQEAWLRWGRQNRYLADDRPESVQMREAANRVWEMSKEYGKETSAILKEVCSDLHYEASLMQVNEEENSGP